jgi:D-alanine-D-alanine ligase
MKYEVIPIGITKAGKFVHHPINPNWKLADYPAVDDSAPELVMPLGGGELRLAGGESLGRIDIAFPVLHGVNGEDGTIQGLLQLCGIPYVGNGVLSSALAMDKAAAKRIFQSAGIPTSEDLVIRKTDYFANADEIVAKASSLMTPNCFVKPSRSGSSVGVTKVKTSESLRPAIERGFEHDDTVLVEIKVHGRDFYDYEAKYIDNSAELIVPVELTGAELKTLQDLAIKAFRALGCSGLARADFFLTSQGFVITEINTMPGFTPISMYPSLWAASGIDYPQLVETLIQTGLSAKR